MPANVDPRTVEGFGDEWSTFDQGKRTKSDLRQTFDRYFSEFPWSALPDDAVGFDAGCGSGRWAALVAPRVGHLVLVDPSSRALAVAVRTVAGTGRCSFVEAAAGELPFGDATMDFGYSLGVLHHTPEPARGLADCVRALRPGAPMLVYLYYALDNRPSWFRALWRASDLMRRRIALLPRRARHVVCSAIAAVAYFPLARLAGPLERVGVAHPPLAAYRDKPFRVMRTDAFDRFATPVEHRFTRDEVVDMLLAAGLEDIRVRPGAPYWCAVGTKKPHR